VRTVSTPKALTRRSDELARQRQELPWVRIDKEYRFDTDDGPASLADLFRGRSQLLVYHFMLGPEYTAGCPACSAIADGFTGFVAHLAKDDVMLWAVSRAPAPRVRNEQRAADDPLSFFRRHDVRQPDDIRTRERPHRRLPQGSEFTATWRQQRCCSYSYRPARTRR
jgi:predicted dithiol-disulfide oxidoreductase (DUF899 family)